MKITISILVFVFSLNGYAQQFADTTFSPLNTKRRFAADEAPIVFIDEAHHNFHTMNGTYEAFTKILKSDGYIVKINAGKFTKELLDNIDVLVISNALSERDLEDYDLPNFSAFRRDELEALYFWVKEGGSLFLIADHMPFPKASESLAAVFGFQFNNGYAMDEDNKDSIFSFSKESLIDHPIRRGMDNSEIIASVRTFTGQAFLSPPDAKPLLVFKRICCYIYAKQALGFDRKNANTFDQ